MSKKRIEDAINDILKHEAQENAQGFIAFLSANEMSFDEIENFWFGIKYKDNYVCFIKIENSDDELGNWTIWSADDYNSKDMDYADEHIKEFGWANICFCGSCGGACAPGRSATIFGKHFDNVCQSAMIFVNPDAKTLENMKQLILLLKSSADMKRT
jgi:hypothetical protein